MTLREHFLHNERGSIVLLFAFGLVLLGGFTGAMVDYSRASSARSRLQSATDALALSYSRDMKAGTYVAGGTGATALASKAFFSSDFLKENYADYSWWSWVGEADPAANRYTVTSRAGVKTSFLNLLRISEVEISATSSSAFSQSQVELALVLDTTASMAAEGRMDALKDAMSNFMDLVERNYGRNNPNFKISVVPFSARVRVPPTTDPNSYWLDWAPGSLVSNWQGCLTDRYDPYDITNYIPNPSITASQYRPVTSTTGACGDDKYASFIPLMYDYSIIRNKISSLPAHAATNIPSGLLWGWNMLSPGRPLSNAAPKAANVKRYLILITDGVNTDDRFGGNGKYDPALNPDIYRIDGRTERACEAIKADGITIFTFRVIEGNEALLEGCASKPSYFYNIYDPRDLKRALENVSFTVSKLRLAN